MSFKPFKISIRESRGFSRKSEPISLGIPIPYGQLFNAKELVLTSQGGKLLIADSRKLAFWPDGSIRWLLMDGLVSVGADERLCLNLCRQPASDLSAPEMVIRKSKSNISVNTGAAIFCIGTAPHLQIFKWIQPKGNDYIKLSGPSIALTDAAGQRWIPVMEQYQIEHDTAVKKVIRISGRFGRKHQWLGLHFDVRIHFFAGLSRVRVDLSIKNPYAAIRRGGGWDLGDPHSIYFKDISFYTIPETKTHLSGCYTVDLMKSVIPCRKETVVFQSSSGGKAWRSGNHKNSKNQIPLKFCGFKVFEEGNTVKSGERAEAIGAVKVGKFWISMACQDFWQNFPKAMKIGPTGICLGLFPDCHGDPFELQPGEQKLHTFYLSFDQEPLTPLCGMMAPLIPVLYSRAMVRGMNSPKPVDIHHPPYDNLIQSVLEGPQSFNTKNEQVDEFGWRNFGDVWADHESIYSETPIISHYNNQYDLIKGLVIQFLRTGDTRWFEMAKCMGDHVVDIDIYHTDLDKPQFNKGMFWHTDHHLDAATATHRTISLDHRVHKPPGSFGGGPAPDHNYTTGLLLLYWLTGETRYSEAVLSLTENIIHCINAPNSFSEMAFDWAKLLARKVRGYKTVGYEDIFRYNGPSRVSGNSLNTLMDAFLLTSDPLYLAYAEDLVQRCVSLEDDFDAMNLKDAERRWMYTIFLQALGRYLEVKHQFGQRDPGFSFAQKVLLRYASWMAEHESPYLSRPDKLKLPTETWAAQDIRKADIFAYAAGHTNGPERELFKEKSRYFLDYALSELASFDTWYFTRPMTIVLTNGMPSLSLLYNKFEMDFPKNASGLSEVRKSLIKNMILRNLKNFSLKKELKWVQIQLRSIW